MATLKQVRKKITSVKNTMQITKAMKMVAAAKLRKAQDIIMAARPYADKMEEMVKNLASHAGEEMDHPLLESREVKKAHIVNLSGDRGLCGAFNSNLIKKTTRIHDRLVGENLEVVMTPVGRKGYEHFNKRGFNIAKHYMNLGSGSDFEIAKTIARELIEAYTEGEFDQVILVYAEFHSPVIQHPREQVILPIAAGEEEEQVKDKEEGDAPELFIDYLYEPGPKELLADLLPKFIEVQVYRAILDNLASEFGARMTAMENATQNAEKMIDSLTLQYNRARQEAITRELMDIVGGAEAQMQ